MELEGQSQASRFMIAQLFLMLAEPDPTSQIGEMFTLAKVVSQELSDFSPKTDTPDDAFLIILTKRFGKALQHRAGPAWESGNFRIRIARNIDSPVVKSIYITFKSTDDALINDLNAAAPTILTLHDVLSHRMFSSIYNPKFGKPSGVYSVLEGSSVLFEEPDYRPMRGPFDSRVLAVHDDADLRAKVDALKSSTVMILTTDRQSHRRERRVERLVNGEIKVEPEVFWENWSLKNQDETRRLFKTDKTLFRGLLVLPVSFWHRQFIKVADASVFIP